MAGEYTTLEEYFEEHPEEYDDFVEDMAEQAYCDEIAEYPEDWLCTSSQ